MLDSQEIDGIFRISFISVIGVEFNYRYSTRCKLGIKTCVLN